MRYIARKIDVTAIMFLLVQNRQQTYHWTLIGPGTNGLGIQECICYSLYMFPFPIVGKPQLKIISFWTYKHWKLVHIWSDKAFNYGYGCDSDIVYLHLVSLHIMLPVHLISKWRPGNDILYFLICFRAYNKQWGMQADKIIPWIFKQLN